MANEDDDYESRLDALEHLTRNEPLTARGDFNSRLAQLEQNVDSMQRVMKPMIDVWNASKLLGKLMFVIGGVLVGVATIWTALSSWIAAHIK